MLVCAVITWFARAGRRYAIEFCDSPGQDAGLRFHSLRGTAPVEVAADEEDGVVAVEVAQLGDAIDLHAAGW